MTSEKSVNHWVFIQALADAPVSAALAAKPTAQSRAIAAKPTAHLMPAAAQPSAHQPNARLPTASTPTASPQKILKLNTPMLIAPTETGAIVRPPMASNGLTAKSPTAIHAHTVRLRFLSAFF